MYPTPTLLFARERMSRLMSRRILVIIVSSLFYLSLIVPLPQQFGSGIPLFSAVNATNYRIARQKSIGFRASKGLVSKETKAR